MSPLARAILDTALILCSSARRTARYLASSATKSTWTVALSARAARTHKVTISSTNRYPQSQNGLGRSSMCLRHDQGGVLAADVKDARWPSQWSAEVRRVAWLDFFFRSACGLAELARAPR